MRSCAEILADIHRTLDELDRLKKLRTALSEEFDQAKRQEISVTK